ncbi:MAG TPA: DsbA family protein [Bryobacteraceae bacterium]|nr:DsbA family protein [Bryobacteraceae bacterium]HOL70279.1 DsbA family protein [Bryobacteraceae bacterium]HPQ16704.1 DsbA family protein [Bryobacteraceae bacterium]
MRAINMHPFLKKTLFALCVAGLGALAVAQRPATGGAAPRKSFYDKAELEQYLRHLYVWGPKISVTISDPKPSAKLPGFNEVNVRASAGQAVQDELFYISTDGQRILKAAVFEFGQNPFKAELDKLKTEFQPSFGTPGAPVVIVVFTDFECPYCKQEAKMLRDNLMNAFPKQVRVYFKDFPLESIHPWAKMASIAGRCVFRQKPAAFWDYHDWVYEHQSEINAGNFKSKVMEFAKTKANEIDVAELTRCMETRATEAEVDRNIAEGKSLGVNSTPTLFVNGRRLVGTMEWHNLRQIIENEIEYQAVAKNAGEDCGCEVKLPTPLSSSN